MQTPPPLIVDRLTKDVADEVRAIAQTLPYRRDRGVDPERVVWIVESSGHRTGVAFAPDQAEGNYWMIAFADIDGKRVPRSRIREVVGLIVGRGASWETAPLFDGAPAMTMVRVQASEYDSTL